MRVLLQKTNKPHHRPPSQLAPRPCHLPLRRALSGEELFEESRDKWILDTHLNGLGAVRRFYLGLADKIEILDTEDAGALKKDIADYVQANILGK